MGKKEEGNSITSQVHLRPPPETMYSQEPEAPILLTTVTMSPLLLRQMMLVIINNSRKNCLKNNDLFFKRENCTLQKYIRKYKEKL